MSSLVIFDTSVLVDDFRTTWHQERMESLAGLVRNSSVVLAELWRGVSNRRERLAVLDLEENHPILTPTAKTWVESGQILAEIGRETGFAPGKLRDLHFDVLIALTARSCGARLITSNRADFELIRDYCSFQLEVWPAPA
jgi:predicted nucleic acid-binding protein